MLVRVLIAAAVLFSVTSANAATLTIGTPENLNGAPFSPPLFEETARYQQVWASSAFADLGPIEITAISFQVPLGPSAISSYSPVAKYDFSFSTTSANVNELDTSQTELGFQSNLGSDNTLFNRTEFTRELLSANPSFSGAYTYDPSKGNLLLDIQISDHTPSLGFFVRATRNSGGLFSRSYDWGGGFSDYGAIVTFEYEPVSEVPLPASGILLLAGFAAVGAIGRKRKPTN